LRIIYIFAEIELQEKICNPEFPGVWREQRKLSEIADILFLLSLQLISRVIEKIK
jgi:hypothetical protein